MGAAAQAKRKHNVGISSLWHVGVGDASGSAIAYLNRRTRLARSSVRRRYDRAHDATGAAVVLFDRRRFVERDHDVVRVAKALDAMRSDCGDPARLRSCRGAGGSEGG